MKTASSKTIRPVATITVDTDPDNLTPYTLTMHTPSGARSYPFARMIEGVWLARFADRNIRIELEVLPKVVSF